MSRTELAVLTATVYGRNVSAFVVTNASLYKEETSGIETVIYDNGLSADDGAGPQEIGGGAVVIHK